MAFGGRKLYETSMLTAEYSSHSLLVFSRPTERVNYLAICNYRYPTTDDSVGQGISTHTPLCPRLVYWVLASIIKYS
jgi:hypothetical protein